MKKVFSPGCALRIYKPELATRMLALLQEEFPGLEEHSICCHHEPQLPAGTEVINVCAGCDRRFRELYETTNTTAFWEILAQSSTFPFPDYQGRQMSILDACPTRNQPRVHNAVRTLLTRMNIRLVEPEHTRTNSTCCGDSFLGKLPIDKVKSLMRKRAAEMPEEDVVVYCVSCIKAMHIGGKQPRYLVDLLFAEETRPDTFEPEEWHAELDDFIAAH